MVFVVALNEEFPNVGSQTRLKTCEMTKPAKLATSQRYYVLLQELVIDNRYNFRALRERVMIRDRIFDRFFFL